jgi:hypothetical protein
VLAIGGFAAAAVQLLLPLGAPLYDGVVNIEPYRFLDPTGSQAGSPSSYTADATVANGRSPAITAATSESPPQAQLIALDGVFAVPPGTPGLHVSIKPVEPAAPVTGGTLSGNVYRIEVTDTSGQPVPMAGSDRPTLGMRSPVPLADAAIFRLVNGTWTRLDSVANPQLSMYTTEPDALGDFAILDTAGGGITTTTLVIAATVGIVVAAVVLWALRLVLRRRAAASAPAPRGREGPGGRGGPGKPSGPTSAGASTARHRPRSSGPPRRR